MRPVRTPEIVALLTGPVLQSAAEVLARIDAVQALLDAEYADADLPSAIHSFNFLYRDITANVVTWLDQGEFQGEEGMNALDVNFYNRYQVALLAYLRDEHPSKCWQRQFDCDEPSAHLVPERRPEFRRPSQLQMAAAGVNAHVNCDLSQAVVRTWSQLGITARDQAFADDFTKINQVFFARIPELVDIYESKDPLHGLHLEGQVPERIEDGLVVGCRALAWQAAIWLHDFHNECLPTQTNPFLDHNAAQLCDVIISPEVSDAVFGPSPHPNALADRIGYHPPDLLPPSQLLDLTCVAPAH